MKKLRDRLHSIIPLLLIIFTLCSCEMMQTEDKSDDKDELASPAVHIALAGSYEMKNGKKYFVLDNVSGAIQSAAQRYTRAGLGEVIIDEVDASSADRDGYKDETYGRRIYDLMYADYQEKSLTDGAADIIVFAPFADYSIGRKYTEYYKYIINGQLADLTEYMDDDGDYDEERYVKPVTDGGKYEGKQYLVPIMYQMLMYGGLTEKSAIYGAPYPTANGNPSSFADFNEFWEKLSAASDYTSELGMSLFGKTLPFGARGYDLCYQLCTDEPMLSLSERMINRSNEAFRIMTASSLKSPNLYTKADMAGNLQTFSYIENDSVCMTLSAIDSWPYSYLKTYLRQIGIGESYTTEFTPYICGLPSIKDIDKHPASITLAMGVSASSENPKEAYKFIKYCLDDGQFIDTLTSDASSEYMYNFPVNKSILESNIKDFFNKPQVDFTGKYDADYIKSMGEQLISELENVSYAAPYYQPLNVIFTRRFRETYNNRGNGDPDALIDEMCDAIDKDLQTFFAS